MKASIPPKKRLQFTLFKKNPSFHLKELFSLKFHVIILLEILIETLEKKLIKQLEKIRL